MDRSVAYGRIVLPSESALIEIDDEGRLVRMSSNSDAAARPIARFKALAWRAAIRRLVSVDSPFLFVKLKGPAATYPMPGETFNAWGTNTGSGPARRTYHVSLGLSSTEADDDAVIYYHATRLEAYRLAVQG